MVTQLVSSLLALTAESALRTRYGPPAMLGLFLLGVGIKARNTTCTRIGAMLLTLTVVSQAS